jgi:hypothetical protein
LPLLATSQVELFVSCVEDLGNGRLLAHFGYENPTQNTINVHYSRSYILYDHGRSRKYVLNTFEPGVHEKAFSQEFDSDDWVKWILRFSWFGIEWTLASSDSEICEADLPVIPYYAPPEGGKVLESKIGAELTSLNTTYLADPANFLGESDFIYQIDGSKVLIEVVAEADQYDNMIGALTGLGFYYSDK